MTSHNTSQTENYFSVLKCFTLNSLLILIESELLLEVNGNNLKLLRVLTKYVERAYVCKNIVLVHLHGHHTPVFWKIGLISLRPFHFIDIEYWKHSGISDTFEFEMFSVTRCWVNKFELYCFCVGFKFMWGVSL